MDGAVQAKEISVLAFLELVLPLITTRLSVSRLSILVTLTALPILVYMVLVSVALVFALVVMEENRVMRLMTVLESWEEALKSMYVEFVMEMEHLVLDVMVLSMDLRMTSVVFVEEMVLLASINVS